MHSFEKSHGKHRPALPRIEDVGPLPKRSRTDAERCADRDQRGRAADGNRLAANRGVKRSIKRLAGQGELSDPVALELVRDALRLMGASLRDLPVSESANVRAHVAMMARHQALAGYFARRALEVGIETDQGASFDARATRHGERSERLLASVLAACKSLGGRRSPTLVDANPLDVMAGDRDG